MNYSEYESPKNNLLELKSASDLIFFKCVHYGIDQK